MTRDPCTITHCFECGATPQESNVNLIKLPSGGWLNLNTITYARHGAITEAGSDKKVPCIKVWKNDGINPLELFGADVAALTAALDSMCLCPVAPASQSPLYVGEPDVPEPPAVEGEG